MGAVTALYYMDFITDRERKRVLGMVLDSPFSDLEDLVIKFCKRKYRIPDFLFKVGLSVINMGVKGKANLDLKSVSFFKTSYLIIK